MKHKGWERSSLLTPSLNPWRSPYWVLVKTGRALAREAIGDVPTKLAYHLSFRFFRIGHPDRCIIAAQNPIQASGKMIMLGHRPTL